MLVLGISIDLHYMELWGNASKRFMDRASQQGRVYERFPWLDRSEPPGSAQSY